MRNSCVSAVRISCAWEQHDEMAQIDKRRQAEMSDGINQSGHEIMESEGPSYTKEDIDIEQQLYKIVRGKNFALNCFS